MPKLIGRDLIKVDIANDLAAWHFLISANYEYMFEVMQNRDLVQLGVLSVNRLTGNDCNGIY